ncbi:MAG: hypothetical protein J6X30_02025 [Clostridia bacterium]|nr:hypothetical protein [Clostridia bacterium]
MKTVRICDTTLCRKGTNLSFKEKLEIARSLEKLQVDAIELPAISEPRTDTLLIRTISAFVQNGVLSVEAGLTRESIEAAVMALERTARPRIRVALPVSPVGMEYTCHKKPQKVLEWIAFAVAEAKKSVPDVEFAAQDATRAEQVFLKEALKTAVQAGASSVTLCDDAAGCLPDEFAAFSASIAAELSVPVYVSISDRSGFASAAAALSVKSGAAGVKTAVGGAVTDLERFAQMLHDCGDSFGFSSRLRYTELHRILGQIKRITGMAQSESGLPRTQSEPDESVHLDAKDDMAAVTEAAAKLGYDLTPDDQKKVYEAFLRVAEKKTVGARELDAIIASSALQVPDTYKLETYMITSGNVVSSSAQITLNKQGESVSGISIGDGPIDAAFRALENVIGHRYELDDFKIQAVTEGKEAMGSAIVKLRANGKLYSGNGISTDIIGASIRAYLGAVNKIVYEEA